LFFIVALLGKGNGLGLVASDLHAQPIARRCNAQVLVAQSANQIEGLSRGLLTRQAHRVVRDALFDRGTHVRSRPEESVRRHKPTQRLVRPLEVVGVDEQLDPSCAIGEVGEHRAREKLVPQRLPEALDLAQGLRVLRPALDVLDPVLA